MGAEPPTQKPVELLELVMSVVSSPGALVLDCFAGSGSTGVAAVRTGRRFTGIELSPEYAALARERVAREFTP